MAGHASELLSVAAAELEVEASSLSSMAARLEKLIIMQERNQTGYSYDWSDEYYIRNEEVQSRIKSAEDTVMKYVELYPELQDRRKSFQFYYDRIKLEIKWGKSTLSNWNEFSEKSRLLMKCAAIARAKMQA